MTLGVDPPPLRPWDYCSPSKTLNAALGDPETERPAKLNLSHWSSDTVDTMLFEVTKFWSNLLHSNR